MIIYNIESIKNQILNGDVLDTLKNIPSDSIDMCITSPPYWGLRDYKGCGWNFEIFKEIAQELYRVTKDGGVVVWVVNDKTKNGSETLTSFRQALYFQEIGFKVHDTMIYEKHNPVPNAKNRYQQSFEYMFVFSKGKAKTTNILEEPRRNECNDKRTYRKKKFTRGQDGEFGEERDYYIKENVPRRNIWTYKVGLYNTTSDKVAFKHPAIFPEKLAEDHILSWSNEGDLVLDIFAGSGTTRKMCKLNNRQYIGFEIAEEYVHIDNERNSEFEN